MAKKTSDVIAGFRVTADGKTINRMIDSLTKRNDKLNTDTHITLMSVVCCVIEHQDANRASLLCNNYLHDGYRANSFARWLLAHGPFKHTLAKDDKGNKVHKFTLDKERAPAYQAEYKKDRAKFIETMNAEPFWLFDAPKPFKGFDLVETLKQAVKRGKDLQEKYSDDPEELAKINVKGLVQAEKFLATLKI